MQQSHFQGQIDASPLVLGHTWQVRSAEAADSRHDGRNCLHVSYFQVWGAGCVICACLNGLHTWVGLVSQMAHSTYTATQVCVTACIHIRTYCTHKSGRMCIGTYACHMLPCIFTVCILLLTLFTANSAPLKYTMLMVPLLPFPILLSTAS